MEILIFLSDAIQYNAIPFSNKTSAIMIAGDTSGTIQVVHWPLFHDLSG